MAADTTKSLDSISSGTLPDQGIDSESATDIDLGIDLGTTRTVVALADRGNYPVISFTDEHGDERDGVVAEVEHARARPAPSLPAPRRAYAAGQGRIICTNGDGRTPPSAR